MPMRRRGSWRIVTAHGGIRARAGCWPRTNRDRRRRGMKPPPFDYRRPNTVAEAVRTLADVGTDAKVLAGGQSLVPVLNMRLAAPSTLVDINRLGPELAGIETVGPTVRV